MRVIFLKKLDNHYEYFNVKTEVCKTYKLIQCLEKLNINYYIKKHITKFS